MIRIASQSGTHPTQKPIDLYRWILKNYAKEGDKILDTHGGSMNIATACEKEGFDLDICEIDTDYFNANILVWAALDMANGIINMQAQLRTGDQ